MIIINPWSHQHNIKTEEDAVLQSKVETLAGENIKLLDDINRLQNAIPFMSGNCKDRRLNETFINHDLLSMITNFRTINRIKCV